MKETKTMIAQERKQEVTELMDFLDDLDQEEKQGFLMFMQGMKAAKSIKVKGTNRTAQSSGIRRYAL